MDTKEMRSKFFLAIILLTPIVVTISAHLYFQKVLQEGPYSQKTRENGDFFKSYFDFNQFKDSKGNSDLISFEDGKWVLSVYITDIKKSEESIYLMKQLNVALNRDINKLKRVAFFSNKLLEKNIEELLAEYPRLILIEDKNGVLLNVLQRNSRTDFNIENPIFVIDPYGRAVMYFDSKTDPKLILKDLKVLI
ncbi:MAG: hypothetical protein ACJ0FR_02265 [Gammaproteobacteria bacterium]|tara:strand:- start:171 stop:749 length:579 start_codon:yes stop_codon:yes gene_type:complete